METTCRSLRIEHCMCHLERQYKLQYDLFEKHKVKLWLIGLEAQMKFNINAPQKIAVIARKLCS